MVLAVLFSAAAPVAYADWSRIASVQFPMRQHHQSLRANFKTDTVALTSSDGDVFCRNVKARFANNLTRTILHNVSLTFEKVVKARLPGGVRNVKRLDFDCWSLYSWRTRVVIDANMTGARASVAKVVPDS